MLPLLPGCAAGLAGLYMLGAGEGQRVSAKYKLPPGVLLLLLDDRGLVETPSFEPTVVDALAQELLRHKVAEKIVPYETIQRLRQVEPRFYERGCREVGELAGADLVLWVEVQDFALEKAPFDPERAALVTVTVKVINVLERERKSKVRLWPDTPAGYLVSAHVDVVKASRADDLAQVERELAQTLADQVAKLFYDHHLPGNYKPES